MALLILSIIILYLCYKNNICNL